MSFFDRTVATEAHINAPWSGNKKNFRCALCGHRFKVGDIFQIILTNGLFHKEKRLPGGNPIVCEPCNTPDVLDKWIALEEEWEQVKNGKFWRFVRDVSRER